MHRVNRLARLVTLRALCIWALGLMGLVGVLITHKAASAFGATHLQHPVFEPNAPLTTATPTRLPVFTLTTPPSAPSSTPVGYFGPDVYEPNDSPAQVLGRTPVVGYLFVGYQFQGLNFNPLPGSTQPLTATQSNGDVDWFFFYAKRHYDLGGTGGCYRLVTNSPPGSDPELFVYAAPPPNTNIGLENIMASNDDASALSRAAQLDLGFAEDGTYWVKVWNRDPLPRGFAQPSYNVALTEYLPAPIPTLRPTLSPVPTTYPQGIDSFEYNGDFDHTWLIASGVKYSNLNFVPYQPISPTVADDDYFRLAMKAGLTYTCETLDLAAGVDTQLRLFNQDRQSIGYNDDASADERTKGILRSRLTWTADYTGTGYLLVNEVTPPLVNETQSRTYSLQCIIGATMPSTLTPKPMATPTATPELVIIPIGPTPEVGDASQQEAPYTQQLTSKPNKGLDVQPAFVSASGCPIAIVRKPLYLPAIFR